MFAVVSAALGCAADDTTSTAEGDASGKADGAGSVYQGPTPSAVACRGPLGTLAISGINANDPSSSAKLIVDVTSNAGRIQRNYQATSTRLDGNLEMVVFNAEGLEGMVILKNFFRYPGARAWVTEAASFYDFAGDFLCERK